MDVKILKTAIAQNSVPKFIIFSGEEQTLCRQYIKRISQVVNKYPKYFDTADEVMVEIDTNLREDFLYVILNDKNLNKKTELIKALIATNRNIIVYNTDYDPKDSLYKDYKDYSVIFKKLDKYSLTCYLLSKLKASKIEVDQEKIERLVDLCDCNLGYCLNEIDKLIVLDQSSSDVVFDFMLEHNFPDYRKVNVFSSVQKLLNRDSSFVKDLTKFDDNSVGLLNLIYKQAQNKLGVSNNIYLANLMKMCSMLDSGIKDGTVNANTAIDYLLVKVL